MLLASETTEKTTVKILLVEDDERITLALAEALTDQHYVVDIASDGQQGWDFVELFFYDLNDTGIGIAPEHLCTYLTQQEHDNVTN